MKSLLIYPVYTEHLSNPNTKIGSREIRIRLVSLCIVHVVLGFTIPYNHIEMKNSKFSDIFSFLFTYLYNTEDGFFSFAYIHKPYLCCCDVISCQYMCRYYKYS